MLQKKWILFILFVVSMCSYFYRSQSYKNKLELSRANQFEVKNELSLVSSINIPITPKYSDISDTNNTSDFNDLVDLYSQYDELKLNDSLIEVQQKIDRGNYISRSNANELSKLERQKFKQYLTTENAIQAVKTKFLLKKHNEINLDIL